MSAQQQAQLEVEQQLHEVIQEAKELGLSEDKISMLAWGCGIKLKGDGHENKHKICKSP